MSGHTPWKNIKHKSPQKQAAVIRKALAWMADYNMTGTERTLHIDMQGKAREVLPVFDALTARLEAAELRDRMRDDGEQHLLGEIEARDARIKELEAALREILIWASPYVSPEPDLDTAFIQIRLAVRAALGDET